MASPTPKDPSQRRRRNKDEFEGFALNLPEENAPGIPEMPAPPKGTPAWHDETLWFWGVMAGSPQAKLWGSTDWAHLIETTRVYQRWVTTDSDTAYVALERAIRSRTALMGYTHGDRLRLRMRTTVIPTEESSPNQPAVHRPARGVARTRDAGRFQVHDGGA